MFTLVTKETLYCTSSMSTTCCKKSVSCRHFMQHNFTKLNHSIFASYLEIIQSNINQRWQSFYVFLGIDLGLKMQWFPLMSNGCGKSRCNTE